MPIRKADRVCFPQSQRAVCLEMEVRVSRVKMDDQIRRLIKVAEDQGWTVRSARNNTKVRFYNADDIFVADSPTRVGQGHALANVKAALRRGGLQLEPEQEPKDQPEIIDLREVELEDEVITPLQALEVLMEHVTSGGEESKELAAAKEMLTVADEKITELQRRNANLERQVTDQAATLSRIADAFELPSWEILSAIAREVGVGSSTRS